MAVSMADIAKLRKLTGAGMMDCKKALTETNNDIEAAIEIIRKKGQAVAAKTPDGFVLIVGYDYYNVLLYDPEKQETYYGGMNDSTALFENGGNEFITHMKKFEK